MINPWQAFCDAVEAMFTPPPVKPTPHAKALADNMRLRARLNELRLTEENALLHEEIRELERQALERARDAGAEAARKRSQPEEVTPTQ